jgi:hypothetical protein
MNQRTSLIGGILSFAAVILLSYINFARSGDGSPFMQLLAPAEVEMPGEREDSTEDSLVQGAGRTMIQSLGFGFLPE